MTEDLIALFLATAGACKLLWALVVCRDCGFTAAMCLIGGTALVALAAALAALHHIGALGALG